MPNLLHAGIIMKLFEWSNVEKNALAAMRLIGRRQFDKIGKEDDWGT